MTPPPKKTKKFRSWKTRSTDSILSQGLAGLTSRINVTRDLLDAWDHAIGKEWAQRGYPVRYDQGTLYIAIQEPIWAQEFEIMSHDIIERLKVTLPSLPVKQLRCEFQKQDSRKPTPIQRQPHQHPEFK